MTAYRYTLRLENGEGLGPVNTPPGDEAALHDSVARDLFYDMNMPSPWDEYKEPALCVKWGKLGDMRSLWCFGFPSRAELRRWLSPETQRAFALLGFRINWIRTPSEMSIVGFSQVIFHSHYAQRRVGREWVNFKGGSNGQATDQ